LLGFPALSTGVRRVTEDEAAAYLHQAAAAIALPIDPAHAPGVVANLRLAARMAALVEARPLDVAQEPAPVFVAGRTP
jgi:hypothetical protein